MKKVLKWARNIALILVIFILLLVAFSQTRIVKNFLRNLIVEKVNEQIVGAEFRLERIEGNFFSTIVFKEMSLIADSDVLFRLEELKIQYKLLSLLRKQITIEQVFLNKPFIFLEHDEEWNFATLFPTKEKEKAQEKKEPKPFSWKVVLQDFSLEKGNISIVMAEKNQMIPQKINDLAIQFSAEYSEKEAEFQLKTFQFATQNPDFTLSQLQFLAEMKEDIVHVTDFELKTKENTIQASAKYNLQEQKPVHFRFEVQPLRLNEFAVFLPELPINKLPDLFITAELEEQSAEMQLSFTENEQTVVAEITADSIFTDVHYAGKLQLENFNIGKWIDAENLDSDIHLDLSFSGNGLEPETANLDIDLLVSSSRIQDKSLDSLQLHLKKREDKIDINSTITGEFGLLTLEGNSHSIFTEPAYHFMVEIEHLNVAPLLANDSLQSDITLQCSVQGKGIEPKTLQTELNLLSTDSSFQDIEVDSLSIQLSYDKEHYEIDNFLLSSSFLDFSLAGSGELNGENEIKYQLQIKELANLQRWLEFETIAATGGMSGTVEGRLDSLFATANIEMQEIVFDEISLQELAGTIHFKKIQEEMDADLDLLFREIGYEDFAIEKVELTVKGNEKRIENRLFAQADSLSLLLQNWVELDSVITIGFDKLNLDYGDMNLHTKHENSRIIIDKNRYTFQDMQLSGEDSMLQIDGTFSPENEQDLQLSLQNLDISLAHEFIDLPIQLQGNLSFAADVKGMLSNPTVNTNVLIDKIQFDENDFQEITVTTKLADKKLQADFEIIRNESERIFGSANLPFDIADSVEVIPQNEPVQISFAVNDLDVGFLSEFSEQVERLTGILDIEFSLSNTLENPELNGGITFKKGSLAVPEFGLQYPELRFEISTKNRKITLQELYLKGGDGFLKMQGWAELEQPLQDGIKEFDISILGKDFLAAGKRELEVLTNMDIALQGTMQKPTYNGTLSITRARVDLDALPGSESPQVNVNEPLLMQAMQKEQTQEEEQEEKIKKQPPFIENLTGALQIKIPRNTWIKNKNLNVEISGDLEIVKTGKNFEIFGFVSTVRGQYTLYGRKFDLGDGTVTFRGGKEINPLLDISITHIFRDINREKRELEIALSGEAMQPDIMFFLDGNEITEADAISYLLFGRSSDQITQGERSEVAGQSESSLAKSMIARQIGGQIATEIGKTLQLDVVEFSGGDDWKQASILVGKYITNDLFLSYQKEFSLGQSKEYVPDKISLEYEINKFLSLQATRGDEKSTGLDFFWKYQKK